MAQDQDMKLPPDGPSTAAPAEDSTVTSLMSAATEYISHANHGEHGEENAAAVLNSIKDLLEALNSGDLARAEAAIIHLGSRSDNSLYKKVGEMARVLHDSLKEFKTTLNPKIYNLVQSDVPDAAGKLQSIIKMTDEAAHKTMEIIDKQTIVTDESIKDLNGLKGILSKMKGEESIALQAFIERQEKRNAALTGNNTDILMAQEFQDLTGQALKKVIKLVTEIEANLITLVKIFGAPAANEMVAPPVDALANPETSKIKQDEADDLLSSFGF